MRIAAVLVFIVVAPALVGAQLVPITSDLQANTYTPASQKRPVVATDTNTGNFVVVWESRFQDGGFYGVFAQRHDSTGARLGTEFQVNAFTASNQEDPAASVDSSTGDFVVAWESVAQDGSSFGVFGRRYASDGATLGSEFQINSYTTSDQSGVTIAADSTSGGFVAAWSSFGQDGHQRGVFARRYDGSGAALGADLQINTFTSRSQNEPAVAVESGTGNFVVVWQSYLQDGDSYGVFARRFDNAGTALGSEFQANSFTAGEQRYPAVSIDPSTASFVIAWSSLDQDGYASGIFGRRFDSAGAATGSEFQVNSFTTSDQNYPSVATDPTSGSFVISWTSAQDGSDEGIFARRYDSGGAAIGGEFQVNLNTSGAQDIPSVAALGGDSFVFGWTDSSGIDGCTGSGTGVFGRRYTSSGSGLGTEFQVNSFTANYQYGASVGVDPSTGRFVIAWSSGYQDGSGNGVFTQRYDSNGASLGTELQVNTFTADDQENPALRVGAAGDFVVVWNSIDQDGESYGVFARRFDSAGSGLGTEFQVNAFTANSQNDSSLGMDEATGTFVVAWQSYDQDGDNLGVFARRFASAGVALGSEFQVNSYTTGIQRFPSVAVDAGNGAFVVTWASQQDGNNEGIFARRYDSNGAALGTEFQVNSYTTAAQSSPAIEADPVTGNLMIAWGSSGQDQSLSGVFGRRYTSAALALGAEFQVNSFTANVQSSPALGLNSNDGNLVVAWESRDQDGSAYGVFARRFTSAGAALGGELQVNTYTAGSQDSPSVDVDPNTGNFVVAWSSYAQDGCGPSSEGGAFFRLYAPATPTPTPGVSTATCPPTPALGCTLPAKGKLIVKGNGDDKDKLTWKFSKGPLLVQNNFGDPTDTTSYAFCVYDGTTKKIDLQIPAGANWLASSTKGYQYKNPLGTNDGVTKMKLLAGAAGKSKLQLKGKGAGLAVPLPASMSQLFTGAPSVVAQLHGNGTCWATSFTPMQSLHKANLFKGKF